VIRVGSFFLTTGRPFAEVSTTSLFLKTDEARDMPVLFRVNKQAIKRRALGGSPFSFLVRFRA
jgi:hypothetical protein